MDQEKISKEIDAVDNFLHAEDLLGLGGSPGEYSSVVFELYKMARSGAGIVTNDQIKQAFRDTFGDLSNSLSADDLRRVKDMLQEIVGSK